MIYLNIQKAPPTRNNTGSNHIEEEATWEQDDYFPISLVPSFL